MTENHTEIQEKEQSTEEILRGFGQRIDAVVTNAGVPWLFNKTTQLSDGRFATLIHRQSDTENDYWVRVHTDTNLSQNNLRGKPYEEWRWDNAAPQDEHKQLVIIFDPSRWREAATVKLGYDEQDLLRIGAEITAFEEALTNQ